ncbi:MAG: DUF234 domain-containing protein [Sulfurospirillum sp.]
MNKPKNMEDAVEYFAVFGGLGIEIDMNLPLLELIKTDILDRYKFLRNDISAYTTKDELFPSILTGAALGDRRTNSTFKRAKVAYNDGMDCVEDLLDLGVIKLESSFEHNYTAERILFTSPFVRFWFSFVSPLFKGIKSGDYGEFYDSFSNKKMEFTQLIFEQLCFELVKLYFRDEKIYNAGRYWDEDREINLLAKTKDGKIIAGSSRYINTKVKKSELTKLKENCKTVGIEPDFLLLFAKKGFTNELKSMKNETLKLFTCRNLKALVEDGD